MATKSTTTAEETTQAVTKEKKFRLEELAKKSMKTFGVTSSTFAGATADLTEAEYTVSEVKKHIDEWKNGVAVKKKKEGK